MSQWTMKVQLYSEKHLCVPLVTNQQAAAFHLSQIWQLKIAPCDYI